MDDLDHNACCDFLKQAGFSDRSPPSQNEYGYGQWWDSSMGGPAFVQMNPDSGKVLAAPFARLLSQVARTGDARIS